MKDDFRKALLWHMDRHGTRPADLARGSGVSLDIIKKLRSASRPNASTNASDAARIAAFYGKTVLAFMRCDDAADEADPFLVLVDQLTEEERRVLAPQIQGLIAARGRR